MFIALIVFIINLSCLKKGVIQAIVSLTIIIFVGLTAYMLRSVTVVDIPQYGTQSQKEMLLICLQHEKNNELSEEEQKHISTTINDIMETCYKHHLNNEEYAKKLLEKQKKELKDKEVLESLNKMMAH